jgi:hypothetical protein
MAQRDAGPAATKSVPEGNACCDCEEDNADFFEHALTQRELVDRMLASAERRRWRWRRGHARHPQIKGGESRDPEFIKNLRIFGRLVEGAIDLWVRVKPCADEAEGKRSTESRDVTAARQPPGSDSPVRSEPGHRRLMTSAGRPGAMRMLVRFRTARAAPWHTQADHADDQLPRELWAGRICSANGSRFLNVAR